jgi:hypothetical protein
MIITSKNNKSKFAVDSLDICGDTVKPVANAKNLGVTIDDEMNMSLQIANVCKACFFYISWIWKIRRFLDFEVTKTLVHALVISRLDFCNSMYFGLPKSQIKRHQKVMNCAARVVFKARKREHITPYLQELHWLPIEERIEFKMLTITQRCVYKTAPSYLNDLVSIYKPTRSFEVRRRKSA